MNNPSVKPLATRIDDEGTLTYAVTLDNSGLITIDFRKPIHWLALSKVEAQELGMQLLRLSADRVISMEVPD